MAIRISTSQGGGKIEELSYTRCSTNLQLTVKIWSIIKWHLCSSVIFLFLVILIQNAYSVTLVIMASVQILDCLFNVIYFELAKSQPDIKDIKDTFIMLS